MKTRCLPTFRDICIVSCFVSCFVCLLLSSLAIADQPGSSEASSKTIDEFWQTVWSQDQRIGYTQTTVQRRMRDGQSVVITDVLLSLRLSRFGQTLTIQEKSHFEETADGQLLRFASVMDNPPNSKVQVNGQVDADAITISTTSGDTETTRQIPGLGTVLSPMWPERFLASEQLAPGENKTFEVFDPDLGALTQVELRHVDSRDATDDEPPGTVHEVAIVQTYPGSPPIRTVAYCDQQWFPFRISLPFLGFEMRRATADEALQPIGEMEFDLAADTMIPVRDGQRLVQADVATYRIRVNGADPKELFAETDHQSVRSVGQNTIELTVQKLGSRSNPDAESQTPVLADEYLSASRFLNFETPAVQQLLNREGDAKPPRDVAHKLEAFVRTYVSDKNFSTAMATAAEVAESKSGDCTEHAVLLAALLRAQGIPSRVVIGFVYSPAHQAFVGHMWTEAYLSETWTGLDAALGSEGMTCGHIAISTSSLAGQNSEPMVEFLPLIHLLGQTSVEILSP